MLIYIIRFIICFISLEKAHWGRGQLSYLFIYLWSIYLFVCFIYNFIKIKENYNQLTNLTTGCIYFWQKAVRGWDINCALCASRCITDKWWECQFFFLVCNSSAEVQVRTGRTCERWKYHELCFQLSATLFANSWNSLTMSFKTYVIPNCVINWRKLKPID